MINSFNDIQLLFETIKSTPKLNELYCILFIYNSPKTMSDSLHESECVFDEELNMWIGRSEADSPDVDGRVYFSFEGNVDVCVGQFVYVKILSYNQCDLVGKVCRVCK